MRVMKPEVMKLLEDTKSLVLFLKEKDKEIKVANSNAQIEYMVRQSDLRKAFEGLSLDDRQMFDDHYGKWFLEMNKKSK